MGTRSTTGSLALAVLLALAGCSDAEPEPVPTSSTPLPPPSCRLPDIKESCLADVATLIERKARLRAEGEKVTRRHVMAVIGPVVESLHEHSALDSYHLDTPSGDLDEESTSTSPLKTTWGGLGSSKSSLWACFSNGDVEVGFSACD